MGKMITIDEERVITDFEKLSKNRKKEVADFVAFLKVKEELEATKEVIRDKDFLKSIMKGDEDFKAGRFKKWSEVREDV
ncbi:MAG: hypothetical protein L0956_05175 [Candidatus Mariimomonas ferrooxydans]